MTPPAPGKTVNIFAAVRLINIWCKSKCIYKKECDPRTEDNQSSVLGEENLLVLGRLAQAECPIACRFKPREGWINGPFGCER